MAWRRGQQLALVQVDPLDLYVEERGRVERDARLGVDELGQPLLVGALDRAQLGAEALLVQHRLQLAQLLEIPDPAVADAPRDQLGEPRVRLQQPAPGRDAVGHVLEALGPDQGEVGKQPRSHQLRVEPRHAVDRVAARRSRGGLMRIRFGCPPR